MEDRIQYKGIDVFKFIMALFVVVLHTHPFYEINDALNFMTADILGRVAVPFFFAATGFLLEKQIDGRKDRTREIIGNYICKVLKLYGIWTIVYLPIIIYDKIIDSDGTLVYDLFTMVRDFLFVGSYSHLWYLLATATGVFLVFVLRKYIGERWTAVLLLILFFMGLLTQSYFGLFMNAVNIDGMLWKLMKAVKKVMVTCRNGVFFGGIFIYMGTLLAEYNVKMKGQTAVSGLVLSIFLFSIEAAFLQKMGFVREQDMYFMLIPTVFFLMLFAVQIEVKADTAFLRKMSMNIYFVHIIYKFVYRQFVGAHDENGFRLFLFTLIGALITAYLMCQFIHRKDK